ncbi:hypothetical protein E4K68_07750 [Desulfosporosinus sp. Sb-LF]|nr:hypothetical protein E4K68_07750 [Desulfosporosinus sp. Sb-LF]
MSYGKNNTPRFTKEKANNSNPNTKFWGVWLPVPTVLAIIVSLFFNWLITQSVGYVESPIEKAAKNIIEEF